MNNYFGFERKSFTPFVIILIGLCIRVYCTSELTQPHIDSIYTHSKVSLNFVRINEELSSSIGNWTSAKHLNGNLKPPDGINYSSLKEQLEASNHPPLYYYIYHTLTPLTSFGLSIMEIGYLLNFALWICAAFIFMKLSHWLFSDPKLELISLMIYCLCLSTITTVILVKSYVLLELLTLILTLVLVKQHMKIHLGLKDYFLTALLVTSMLLTHYFSYLVLGMVGLLLLVWHGIIKRNWMNVVNYGITSLVAIAVSYFIYPNVIRDITSDGISIKVQSKLTKIEEVTSKLDGAFVNIVDHLLTPPILIISGIGLIYSFINKKRQPFNYTALSIGVLGIVTYFLLYQFVPVNATLHRYGSMVAPLLFVLPVLCCRHLIRHSKIGFLLIAIVLFITPIWNLTLGHVGSKNSKDLIQYWITEPNLQQLNNSSEKIIVVIRSVKDRAKIIPYDFPKSELLFATQRIGGKEVSTLIERNSTQPDPPLILVENRGRRNFHETITNELPQFGYESIGRHRDYLVYIVRKSNSNDQQ